ncbi:MAG: nucleotidyltransferase domain-containing protein [Fusobacteriaceae bacterium]|jgi:predicted nucleotidyltransferase|nr:nucleotidyltransferase domain-containing protein [Fusobacteriaceae bacterium]
MLDQIKKFCDAVVANYSESVDAIYLYGSYARGDNHNESDIDIMVLVDANTVVIQKGISDLASDACLFSGHFFSPVITDKDVFAKWVPYLPFYSNVLKEGKLLYKRGEKGES